MRRIIVGVIWLGLGLGLTELIASVLEQRSTAGVEQFHSTDADVARGQAVRSQTSK